MASFTSSSWQPAEKPKRKKTPKPARQRKAKKINPLVFAIPVLVIILAVVGYMYGPTLVQKVAGSSSTSSTPVATPVQSETLPEEQPPLVVDPPILAQMVTTSYEQAVTTQGQADVNGSPMTFQTVWLQDASQGTGTVTWEGITAEVKLYKGTLLVKNDTKLLDKYTGVPVGVDGWVIVVDETPLLRAFPGKAGVTPLTMATPEMIQVENESVTVGDITATVIDGAISHYTLPSVEYSISTIDPAQVQGISPDTFKADGELRKNEAGVWTPARYE